MTKPNRAADATAVPITTRRGLLKAGGALGTVAALAVPAAVLPKAQAAEACTLSPAFAALHRERAALQRRADEAAAAVMADATDDDAKEQAAQAALAALWATDERLMATPAVRSADIGIKGAFLAEQLEEFENIERRHAVAVAADLCRLFPIAGAASGGRP
ncbi:hypothetical protein [Xanthobacter wiegelii]|uniref:hypothetical protein n=1 Tax=Xanthobacter wiegelii TaxID=3119913 RepID=UPI0037274320